MFKTILCPIDGSGHADKALDLAIDMASRHEARLVLFHVLLPGYTEELSHFAEVEGLSKKVLPAMDLMKSRDPMIDISRPLASDPVPANVLADIGSYLLTSGENRAKAGGVAEISTLMATGDAPVQILHAARRESVDCIVMGCRGLSGAKGLVLGSVSHKVSSRSSCTCITVK